MLKDCYYFERRGHKREARGWIVDKGGVEVYTKNYYACFNWPMARKQVEGKTVGEFMRFLTAR